WNVHVHLSTTRGGLCADQTTWQSLYFAKHSLMPMWRYEIINLLRNAYETLTLPPTLSTYTLWNRGWISIIKNRGLSIWLKPLKIIKKM
ncbi:hypothetical protein B9G39_25800, partial [Zooshikella ganghwensis]